MKYYFYDTDGNVTIIYHITPPIESLLQPHIKSDKVFEDKPNMITNYKVNLETKGLYAEYTPRELTMKEKVDRLEKEMKKIKSIYATLLNSQKIK